jgi:transcriptional regulator GlxA family with amidase domain
MQKWSKSPNQPLEIRFLLFDRFSNLCRANCLEPMRATNNFVGQPVFHWRFLTPANGPVSSSSGLPVLSKGAAEACDACDFLFILASYGHLDHDTPETRRLLRQIAHKAKTIVGFDTSPWLIAAAGLLDGCQATVHYDVFDAFAEQFFSGRGALPTHRA